MDDKSKKNLISGLKKFHIIQIK